MAAEPINLFSHRIDLRGVVDLLRSLNPKVQVVGPEDNWERIVVPAPRRGVKKAPMLTLIHNAEYYEGPGWPRQVSGMQGYFSRFPNVESKPEILRMIGAFRFALATDFQPDFDPDGDERLDYLFAVARHLDGVIFTPSSLRNAEGRILIDAQGESDREAVLPWMPLESDTPDALSAESVNEQESPERAPPSPERVAARALVLAAVAGRALLEPEDAADPEIKATRTRILEWVDLLEIGDEIEPEEWKVLQRPVGKLERQAVINGTWRLEGLAVLAWALGRFELPVYDELVVPNALLESVYMLDEDEAIALLQAPDLREPEELMAQWRRLVAVHWRLRDFTLRPQSTNFEELPGKGGWFGQFDLTACRLIKGDLALGEAALADAPKDAFQTALSIAQERHLAINWLLGDAEIYSETDTST